MSFVAAIQTLAKAGFSCDDRISAPLVACTLVRQGLLAGTQSQKYQQHHYPPMVAARPWSSPSGQHQTFDLLGE
jgi:hypothetical protein